MNDEIYKSDDPIFTIAAVRFQLDRARNEKEQVRQMLWSLIAAGNNLAKIVRGPAHGPGEWDGEVDLWDIAVKEARHKWRDTRP